MNLVLVPRTVSVVFVTSGAEAVAFRYLVVADTVGTVTVPVTVEVPFVPVTVTL